MIRQNKRRYPRLVALIVVGAVSVAVAGCGASHKLAKYDLHGQRVELRSIGEVTGEVESDLGALPESPVLRAVAGLGTASLTSSVATKLNDAVTSEALARDVSRAFARSLADVLGASSSESTDTSAKFIVETRLLHFGLTSDPSGVAAHVVAYTRIMQRGTGVIVWDQKAWRTVPLASTGVDPHASSVLRGSVSAAKLLEMQSTELAAAFHETARRIGQMIGEALRQDVAEMTN